MISECLLKKKLKGVPKRINDLKISKKNEGNRNVRFAALAEVILTKFQIQLQSSPTDGAVDLRNQ